MLVKNYGFVQSNFKSVGIDAYVGQWHSACSYVGESTPVTTS